MNSPSLQHRSSDLEHHIAQAKRWLDSSENGTFTTHLSYAAFEIRLAVERICLHYYVKIAGLEEVKIDPDAIGSFKKMKNKIFGITGHQNEINKQFEITRTILEILNIPVVIHTPDLGRFSAIWHDCSEACHIFWNMTAELAIKEHQNYDPYSDLVKYIEELTTFTEAAVYWFRIRDVSINEIFDDFDGSVEQKEKIKKHFEKIGLYAELVQNDGAKTSIVGTPIMPGNTAE